jgi:hypothetical protein
MRYVRYEIMNKIGFWRKYYFAPGSAGQSEENQEKSWAIYPAHGWVQNYDRILLAMNQIW